MQVNSGAGPGLACRMADERPPGTDDAFFDQASTEEELFGAKERARKSFQLVVALLFVLGCGIGMCFAIYRSVR